MVTSLDKDWYVHRLNSSGPRQTWISQASEIRGGDKLLQQTEPSIRSMHEDLACSFLKKDPCPGGLLSLCNSPYHCHPFHLSTFFLPDSSLNCTTEPLPCPRPHPHPHTHALTISYKIQPTRLRFPSTQMLFSEGAIEVGE